LAHGKPARGSDNKTMFNAVPNYDVTDVTAAGLSELCIGAHDQPELGNAIYGSQRLRLHGRCERASPGSLTVALVILLMAIRTGAGFRRKMVPGGGTRYNTQGRRALERAAL